MPARILSATRLPHTFPSAPTPYLLLVMVTHTQTPQITGGELFAPPPTNPDRLPNIEPAGPLPGAIERPEPPRIAEDPR